jgi:peroxiredoxin
MRRLQTLLDRCGSQGFTILGFNVTDNREIALEELRRQDVRFPSVIDTSQEAWEVHYKYPDAKTPTYYLIDRQGRIAEAWSEDDERNTHLVNALTKLGIAAPTTQTSRPAE